MSKSPEKINRTITGTLTFTPVEHGLPLGKYVYQRVAPGQGNVTGIGDKSLQLRKWRKTPNPNTPPQQAARARLRAAVAAWHALTDSGRQDYRHRAVKLSRTGYNLFISEYIATH